MSWHLKAVSWSLEAVSWLQGHEDKSWPAQSEEWLLEGEKWLLEVPNTGCFTATDMKKIDISQHLSFIECYMMVQMQAN